MFAASRGIIGASRAKPVITTVTQGINSLGNTYGYSSANFSFDGLYGSINKDYEQYSISNVSWYDFSGTVVFRFGVDGDHPTSIFYSVIPEDEPELFAADASRAYYSTENVTVWDWSGGLSRPAIWDGSGDVKFIINK